MTSRYHERESKTENNGVRVGMSFLRDDIPDEEQIGRKILVDTSWKSKEVSFEREIILDPDRNSKK